MSIVAATDSVIDLFDTTESLSLMSPSRRGCVCLLVLVLMLVAVIAFVVLVVIGGAQLSAGSSNGPLVPARSVTQGGGVRC